MTALKGFVNGHTVVADDFLGNMYDGKEVIITILDTFRNKKKTKAVKTKKYTAVREGLTEVVAIPTYIGVAKVAEKIATNLKVSILPFKLII